MQIPSTRLGSETQKGPSSKGPTSQLDITSFLGNPLLLLQPRVPGVLTPPSGRERLVLAGSAGEACSPESGAASRPCSNKRGWSGPGQPPPPPSGKAFLPLAGRGAPVQLPGNLTLSPGSPGLGYSSEDQDSGQLTRLLCLRRGQPIRTSPLQPAPLGRASPAVTSLQSSHLAERVSTDDYTP